MDPAPISAMFEVPPLLSSHSHERDHPSLRLVTGRK
jgi:hypothetical protein